MKENQLKAPFTYFGGKSIVSSFVWQLLGNDIKRYFEPFAGSLAVLLARKREKGLVYHDIVNDLDCLIINVWKALKYAPEKLAYLCVDPVSHVLLWQRACFIVEHKDYLLKRMLEDDNYYDVKLAAYWLYIKATEIGVIDLDKVDTKKIFSGIDNGLSAGRPQLMNSVGIHSFCVRDKKSDMDKIDRLKNLV